MITSKGNLRVKEIRLLKLAKYRKARREYFIEGVRLVEEALQIPGLFRQVVHSPRLEKARRGAELLSIARSQAREAEWLYVSDEVMAGICDTRSHQGILAVLKMSAEHGEEILKREGVILILHDLRFQPEGDDRRGHGQPDLLDGDHSHHRHRLQLPDDLPGTLGRLIFTTCSGLRT